MTFVASLGSRFYEKLAFKRQNRNIRIVVIAVSLKKKSRKKVKTRKYGTLRGRPKRTLAENGTDTVRCGTVDG
jgi:hypothetical protein